MLFSFPYNFQRKFFGNSKNRTFYVENFRCQRIDRLNNIFIKFFSITQKLLSFYFCYIILKKETDG